MSLNEAVSIFEKNYPDYKIITYKELSSRFVFLAVRSNELPLKGIPLDAYYTVEKNSKKAYAFQPSMDKEFFSKKSVMYNK